MESSEKIQELIDIAEAFFTAGDLKSAYDNYRDAAIKGSGDAAYRLGEFFEKGLYVKCNIKAAKQWYFTAATKGNKQAKERLDKGLPKDYPKEDDEPKNEDFVEPETHTTTSEQSPSIGEKPAAVLEELVTRDDELTANLFSNSGLFQKNGATIKFEDKQNDTIIDCILESKPIQKTNPEPEPPKDNNKPGINNSRPIQESSTFTAAKDDIQDATKGLPKQEEDDSKPIIVEKPEAKIECKENIDTQSSEPPKDNNKPGINNSRPIQESSTFTAAKDNINERQVKNIPARKMFANAFKFKGRIARMEFNISLVISFISIIILYSLDLHFEHIIKLMKHKIDIDIPVVFLVVFILLLLLHIPVLWFFYAQSAKRCHDRGNSGWCQMNPIYYFILIFGKSDDNPNKYGFPQYGFYGEVEPSVMDEMWQYTSKEGRRSRIKTTLLIIVAAIIAILLPILEFIIAVRLNSLFIIFITPVIAYLASYLFINKTYLRRDKIFISGTILMTFLWWLFLVVFLFLAIYLSD